MRRTAVVVVLLVASGCKLTSHAVQRSVVGEARSSNDLLEVIDLPGSVTVETVVAADKSVARSGLINLESPRAKEVGLTEGDEPIQVYFHALRHPTKGLFVVDTGVEVALRDRPQAAAFRGIVASYLKLETMQIKMPLGEWLAGQQEPLRGVLLTHLHPDHITGMADAPKGTPVFVGPEEASSRALVNLLLQANLDRAFNGKGAIGEWPFEPDAGGRFEGVVDVFGDGMVWALWVPGHTPGETAYLVRTPKGPVLLAGDACHTRWGWEHDVEPGTFSSDLPRSAESLARLRKLVREHPAILLRFGHTP